MKKTLFLFFVLAGVAIRAEAQGCSTCGGFGQGASRGNNTGPNFNISLGNAQYGQSAGDLTFGSSVPNAALYTPKALRFNFPTRTDVTVVTNSDGSIRQVKAPQSLADVPIPPTTNGYVINFYYPSQITGTNAGGLYLTNGTAPFITWIITNSNPASINQLQVSEIGNVPNYGLMKQWTYTYSTNTGVWSAQSLGGIQENMCVTNLSADTYQVINTVQYAGGPVVQQVKNTYHTHRWSACTNVALIRVDVGSDTAPQTTTYTYQDPASFNAGAIPLPEYVTHPDGSKEYYADYDTNGNPKTVYSMFADNVSGRVTTNVYDPVAAGVSGSGDDGTLNKTTARLVVETVGSEVSRRYTVFPSVGVRLDIQCTTPGVLWNDSRNLVTTNLFYTSGPNQFALQAVIHPDGTATTYNYITNGTYQTNITVTGQPDSPFTHIVDGVSNQTVLNQWGYRVSSISSDIQSGIILQQDIYGNFDSYGQPRQVVHLDGTTNVTQYACCGLDYTVDRDGVTTAYLYDDDKRQIGSSRYYQGIANNPITYQNVLDAAGRALKSVRVGTDTSQITTSQSAYDLAGELIAQTNALGGVTTYLRANDPTTGGLIRTIVRPDGGAITNYYYADGSLEKVVGTAVHPVRYEYGVESDDNGNRCTFVTETHLNANGNPSSEWTKTYTDMAGRTTEIRYADFNYDCYCYSHSQMFYNNRGQLWKQIDPDGVVTLYQYNAKSELAYTAIDMDRNNTIDFSGTGTDRITQTQRSVVPAASGKPDLIRTDTQVWENGQSTGTLISRSEVSTDGLKTWKTQYRDASTPVTASSQTIPGILRVVTNTAPDNSYTINTYSYGRLVSNTRYDSTRTTIGGTSYTNDTHGRTLTVTDARNGATTYGYNNADQINSVTSPAPGNSQSAEVTTTLYNSMMRPYSVIQPDGTTVNSVYLLTGELGLQYGSRIYPVAYSYDYAGRLKTMTNWSNFGSLAGARVTTWDYDIYRGFLTGKTYDSADNGGVAGPSYDYTAAGRLNTRTWARMVGGQSLVTTYSYDNGGGLYTVSYSDSTPGVTYTYDRTGQAKHHCL